MASGGLLERWLIPQQPQPVPTVRPGLHAFEHETSDGLTRFHVRVDRDGAGLLLADASAAARLSAPGVVMAIARLSGRDDGSILHEISSRFSGASRASQRADLARVDALIAELADPQIAYPVLNLDDPARPHHEAELIAPFVADVPVPAPEQVRTLVERLWQAAIPQVTFVAGAEDDPVRLWQAVERARDIGMIAGVRAPGALLAQEGLLERLAGAGLDFVTVFFAAAEPRVHDALLSAGDHSATLQTFAQARVLEICTVAQVPLVEVTVPNLDDTLEAVVEAGVRTTAVFAVAAPAGQATDGALSGGALRQVAASVEEAGLQVDVRCFWQAPVMRNADVSLAAQIRADTQSYMFSVPRLDMQVFVQPDASVRIAYDITFRPRSGTHAIDIVDIGLPHAGYDIGTMQASIEGESLHTIRKSQYVDPGVEVHLGDRAIQAGEEGTVHFEFTMPDMVYRDTTRDDHASLRITPTWFDRQFVVGTGEIRVAVHVPAGVKPEEVLHQGTSFSAKSIFQDRVVAVWTWEDARAVQPFLVGISFPGRSMDRVVEQNVWGLLVKRFEERPAAVRVAVFVLTATLLAFAFFRFTGRTGISVYVVLVIGMYFALRDSAVGLLLSPLVASALLVLSVLSVRRRRGRYLPAIAQVEGGGIKRGLTAPEAAVILELPLGKVLGLVIFALLKKGVLRQVQATPLSVEVDEAFRAGSHTLGAVARLKLRRQAAQQRGVVLHKYELAFVDGLEDNAGGPVRRIDIAGPIMALIEHTAARMKGFDLSNTRDYYRRVVDRALESARSVADIQTREQALDRDLEWILMGDDYHELFHDDCPSSLPIRRAQSAMTTDERR